MNEYKGHELTICVLDYNRPNETKKLFESIKEYAQFRHDVVYLSNGGKQEHALELYKNGEIDTLILNQFNNGCGLGTRQVFQSAMGKYVIYVQSDQFLYRPLTQGQIDAITSALEANPGALYCDLAGNQGHGKFSERAFLINRKRYLDIPDLDKTIGGPGPWANYRWTENLVQEYMAKEGLRFFTDQGLHFFADNGKWSYREYPCGGETLHSTDQKVLRIIKPLKRRYNFPNLNLNESEWSDVLSGAWPVEGKIPEADKAHSFHVWN